jgi:hypothetical protein
MELPRLASPKSAEIACATTTTDLARTAGQDIFALHPRKERAAIGVVIGARIRLHLHRTVPNDYQKEGPLSDKHAISRVRHEFNQFLVRMARDIGARIFCSDEVLSALVEWEQSETNGRALLEEFFKNIVRHSKRISGRTGKPEIFKDPGPSKVKRARN